MRNCLMMLVATAVAVGAGRAQDGPQSGPQKDERLPGPFHPLNVTGDPDAVGKPHCLVCEYGLRPVVAVFARDPRDPGTAALLKKLEEALARHAKAEWKAFAVFLFSDFADFDKRQEQIKAIEGLARGEGGTLKRVVLALDNPADPLLKEYKLADEAEVTVLAYRKQTVVANRSFAKGGLTEAAAEQLVKDVEAALGKPAPK